jgi:hypothetical protein
VLELDGQRLEESPALQGMDRRGGRPVVGPGVVHRCAAALQKTFVVAAHSETAHAPRHLKATAGG